MDTVLRSVGDALPPAAKQPLQDLIDSMQLQQMAEGLPRDLQQVLATPEGLVLLIATVLLAAVLLPLLVRPGKGSKGSTVLLVGPSNAGKTAMFHQLRDGQLHNGSVASLAENAAACAIAAGDGRTRTVRLVDVPGHASLRSRLEALLAEASGVVFVVDAVDLTPHRTEAADLLYEVLVHPAVGRRRVPLLIACNKMDMDADAHSKDFIRKTLERQLDSIRKTRTAGIGKEACGTTALGAPNKAFALASLPNRVALAEVSAKAGQLDEVRAFAVACA